MRATLAYTAVRFVLFAVAVGLIYLAGARGLLLIALALLVSGAASYILLSRMRDSMASSINRRIESVRSRIDEGSRVEDDR
jgi:NADH:ubiquinone oxidoreductase subunit 2 (subunit N)